MRTPFSLRIFVADGDPDGLRIVERSNWVGRALVFPRATWPQPSVANRPELQQTGVYLLLGPREDGEGDRLYIGEGDPIKPRLASHHSGTAQKDFWTRAICFVSMGQVAMARGRPRRHAGVFAIHAGHAASAGRARVRAAPQAPAASACWRNKAMTTLSRRTTPSAHPVRPPVWCWAAAPMGGWSGRMRRAFPSRCFSRLPIDEIFAIREWRINC